MHFFVKIIHARICGKNEAHLHRLPDLGVFIADGVVPDGQLRSLHFRHGIVEAHVFPYSEKRSVRTRKEGTTSRSLLVEAFLYVGHALEVSGDVGAVLRRVLHFVLSGQVV